LGGEGIKGMGIAIAAGKKTGDTKGENRRKNAATLNQTTFGKRETAAVGAKWVRPSDLRAISGSGILL